MVSLEAGQHLLPRNLRCFGYLLRKFEAQGFQHALQGERRCSHITRLLLSAVHVFVGAAPENTPRINPDAARGMRTFIFNGFRVTHVRAALRQFRAHAPELCVDKNHQRT